LPFCGVTLRGRKPYPPAYPRELRTVGDRLRKRRLDLGLRQKDVARMLGVDEMTVNNWERKRTKPADRMLPKVKLFLGTWVGQIMS
jgi:transcriptional regulator with XRE-family HTH domain